VKLAGRAPDVVGINSAQPLQLRSFAVPVGDGLIGADGFDAEALVQRVGDELNSGF